MNVINQTPHAIRIERSILMGFFATTDVLDSRFRPTCVVCKRVLDDELAVPITLAEFEQLEDQLAHYGVETLTLVERHILSGCCAVHDRCIDCIKPDDGSAVDHY